jgi:Uma2 family endonuclease
LMQMAAKGTRHSVCNTKLYQELYELIKGLAVVRGQEPIILKSDSEPEPDVVIARGQADDYLSNHPLPEDILLVIEVSDSTLKYDRNTKLELYAEAQISDYWIFNLLGNQLERHSQPYQDAQGNFGYRIKQIYLSNESVKLPSFPDLSLKLVRVFPA